MRSKVQLEVEKDIRVAQMIHSTRTDVLKE